MKTKKLSNFCKFSFVVLAAVLALALVQTTVAFAGSVYGKCGKVFDDGKDDGYGCYSIQDVSLNWCNAIKSTDLENEGDHGWDHGFDHYDAYNAISINNKGDKADYDFGNDSKYIFSDDDGHYDINRLSLVCETLGYNGVDVYYALAFVYDTDTWDLDSNGESFHVTGDIVINNGEKVIPVTNWFEDRSDSGSYDYMFIWQMKKSEFDKLIPDCKDMQSAINEGVVSVNLKELECRSYNQHADHWVKFDTTHLKLDDTSIKFDGYPAIHDGRTNRSSDGRHYQFNDEIDETYDIYNLNLQAFSYDHSGEENIYLTYHTNTPYTDSNGEDFRGSFDIYVDGKIFKSFNFNFTDNTDSGEAEDGYLVWTYDTQKFISEVGCSLGEGIANGRIVVQMKTLVCDPC